jgi:hypothetical protein
MQEPTRSALASCWRHKGHLVALLGSSSRTRKTPRRQVPLKERVLNAPYYFPCGASVAPYSGDQIHSGESGECRAKLKILFVSSSLASPGDRLSGLWARIFQQGKGA